MPELLLEIGCEELPASFVEPACSQLAAALAARLGTLIKGPVQTYCTPRRLIVGCEDVAPQEEDATVVQRGPALKAAYDEEGQPSKALEGFCKSQGVDPAAVRTEGDYVWVDKFVKGRSTAEILASELPEIIKSLTFPKSMRWAHTKLRFARPIRWIVAVFNGKPVEFRIETVTSGNLSRGHRVYFPEPFVAISLDDLLSGLRERQVEPDPARRLNMILEGAQSALKGTGLQAKNVDGVAEENAQIAEWPAALTGEFDEDYLELPDFVLETVMVKHERFFPVVDASGKLTNRFVSVRNGGAEDTVRKGNRWVLGCRINDAKFFFDEDKKKTLKDFLDATSGMTFQAKLGTVRERATRLSVLTQAVAAALRLPEASLEQALLAGLYAKADLTSGLVSELASLQGKVGGFYARRENFPEPVCQAIERQYDPQLRPGLSDDDLVGFSLAVADQLDKLAGYLGLGLVPSGSADPYGLRRAAAILVASSLECEVDVDFLPLFERALAGYSLDAEPAKVIGDAKDVLTQRLKLALTDTPDDHLEAVLACEEGLAFRPLEVRQRLEVLADLAGDTGFVQTATRPANLLGSLRKKGIAIPPRQDTALNSEAGMALAAALETAHKSAATEGIIPALRSLTGPIDAFFESTMMMVDDEAERGARLALLQDVDRMFRRVADFSQLVSS